MCGYDLHHLEIFSPQVFIKLSWNKPFVRLDRTADWFRTALRSGKNVRRFADVIFKFR